MSLFPEPTGVLPYMGKEPCEEEVILDYVGESNVITRILIGRKQEGHSLRRRYEDRIKVRKRQTDMHAHTYRLILKMLHF